LQQSRKILSEKFLEIDGVIVKFLEPVLKITISKIAILV